jgi:hypothetical protein
MGLFIPLFIMAVRSTQGMGWTADCHPVILGAFRYYLPRGFPVRHTSLADRSDGARQKTTPRVVFLAYYCT